MRPQPPFSSPMRNLARHPDVVEERRVDVVLAHQLQRLQGDARGVHRYDDDRNALVLLGFRIGAHGQPAVVGAARQAGPHLLAVDDVLVAVANRPGLQRCKVGAGLRLGITDAEMQVTGKNLRQEEFLLPFGAVIHDRGTDGVERQHRDRCPGAHRFIEEDELVDGPALLAAVLLGPAHSRPAVGAHLLPDPLGRFADAVAVRQLLDRVGVEQLVVIGPQFGAESFLVRRVIDFHDVQKVGAGVRGENTYLTSPVDHRSADWPARTCQETESHGNLHQLH